MTAVAKIFKNGRSQAIRLPKDFRLPGRIASVSHLGNAVLLQPISETWLDVYNAMSGLETFMEDREDLPAQEREEL